MCGGVKLVTYQLRRQVITGDNGKAYVLWVTPEGRLICQQNQSDQYCLKIAKNFENSVNQGMRHGEDVLSLEPFSPPTPKNVLSDPMLIVFALLGLAAMILILESTENRGH